MKTRLRSDACAAFEGYLSQLKDIFVTFAACITPVLVLHKSCRLSCFPAVFAAYIAPAVVLHKRFALQPFSCSIHNLHCARLLLRIINASLCSHFLLICHIDHAHRCASSILSLAVNSLLYLYAACISPAVVNHNRCRF